MIDRTTAWPESIPTNCITDEAVAQLLVEHWISRFSALLFITSDQGRQFESELFRSLSDVIGCDE